MRIPKKERFLKKLYNILRDDNFEVLFYDEAFFRRESTVTRGWYPRGSKQEIACPATFDKVGVCGAVTTRNGTLSSLIFNGFDSDTFIYYLQWLLDNYQTNKKIVLILDNATSHKSKKVMEFVEENENHLDLLFLPPYSPDLNTVERVWKDLRYQETHNIYFENNEKLENAVARYLSRYAGPNERLKNLCCIN